MSNRDEASVSRTLCDREAELTENEARYRRAEEALRLANERQQAVMLAYAEIAQAGLNKTELTRRTAARAMALVGADLCGVGCIVGDEIEYTILGEAHDPTTMRVHRSASMSGECATTMRTIVCNEVVQEPRTSQVATQRLGVRSLLLVPLVHHGQAIGVLMAGSRSPGAFSAASAHSLELIAGVLSGAMANADAFQERDLLVAERTAAVERVAKSEALFRALTENSSELLNIFDADGRFKYNSPSSPRILGYEPHELIGTNLLSLVHEEDRESVIERLKELRHSEGASCTAVARMRHKDGSWRYVEGNCRNLLHIPAVQGIACNARDVTGRVNATKAIEFQAQLLETVEQAVIATDLEGRITHWNKGAERMYGWSATEVLGHPISQHVKTIAASDLSAEIIAHVATGKSWSGEVDASRRDGTTFFKMLTVTPVYDAMKKMIGSVGISTDLTNRRELEYQLRQAQKMEAIGQLAGGVAHDFNNLLTVITSYSEFLLEQVESGAMRDDVMEIREAARRAAELTSQLLAFSRKQVMRVEALDVAEVIRGLEKMLRRLIDESVILDAIYPRESAWVMADRSQLEQVVVNLVVNARDAMPEGGHLRVIVEAAPARPGVAARVALRVLDTGCGMTEAVRSRIFEPFYTTKGEGKGTGLGLSVVYGIVQQLSGSIDVVSAPGQGTDFRIELPSAEAKAPAVKSDDSRGESGTETILLVEDNEPLAEVAARVLERFGYRVICARDGLEARRMLTAAPVPGIDLLVTDVVMPECSGPALVKQLADAGLRPRVLYMSGYASPANVTAEELTNGADFLPKPWTPRELAHAVRHALDKEMVAA